MSLFANMAALYIMVLIVVNIYISLVSVKVKNIFSNTDSLFRFIICEIFVEELFSHFPLFF